MEDTVVQLGIGGIFSVLILKEVFAFLRGWMAKRNGRNSKPEEAMKDVHAHVERIDTTVTRIFEMHDVKDSDGVYSWYVRRSLEETITNLAECVQSSNDKLTDAIQAQTLGFRELAMELKSHGSISGSK